MARFVCLLVFVSAVAAVPVPEAPPPDPVVEQALAYLDGTQNEKGEWSTRVGNNLAATGLSVLAYLSAGVKPDDAKRGPALKKAVASILVTQDQQGLFKEPRSSTTLYSHGIATWAVAEYALAHGKNPPEHLKPALERAVGLLVKAQDPKGGWRYTANPQPGDLSISSWQILALRAAQKAGVEVPGRTLAAALDFVESCRKKDQGFQYVPQSSNVAPACTAAGVLHLSLAGAPSDRADMVALHFAILKQIPTTTNYVAYAAHAQAQALARFPGKEAEAGLAQLRERIVKLQTDKGAIDSRGGSDQSYGSGLCTPLAILALTAKDRRLAVMKAEK
jgi:hypothetical protein